MKKQVINIIVLTALFVTMICSSAFASEPIVSIVMNGYDDGYTIEYSDTSKKSYAPVILLLVNGDIISDANAIIKNGTTLIPLRIVSNRLGATTKWNSETKTIDIQKSNTKIQMTIGSKNIIINGKQKKISNAPEIIGSLTYVPLRAIASAFEAEVGYVDNLLDHTSDLKVVYVQDRKEQILISEREAKKKKKNVYFNDFLPTMQESILEIWNVNVDDIDITNIHSKLNKDFVGKCIADFGEYYYIQLFNNNMEYVLVDKYNGICYPVSSYSLVLFEVAYPNCFSGWAWHYQ